MYGVYIYTYIWLIFIVNVGKYTIPMDTMGYVYSPEVVLNGRQEMRSLGALRQRAETMSYC